MSWVLQQGYGQSSIQFPKPALWVQTHALENDQFAWMDITTQHARPIILSEGHLSPKKQVLNFNPALFFGNTKIPVKFPLPSNFKGKYDLFSIYQVDEKHEECHLWNIEKEDQATQIMTTHRVADLVELRYMNFSTKQRGAPELSHYFQAGQLAPVRGSRSIQWGGVPAKPHLPIQPFKGIIPEWIFFDRVLSSQESKIVESYLALKYGLTLRRPITADYLDSQGNKIWDGQQNAPYHHQVSGIGRDVGSGLNQKKSTTSVFPSVVCIGIFDHSHFFNEGDFLVWGNNHQPLDWEAGAAGFAQTLLRSWRIQISNHAGEIPTRFELFTKHLFGTLEPEEHYWLVVDFSDEGQFQAENVSFFPILHKNQRWIADSIRWGGLGFETAYFKIAKGPAFFPYVSTLKPYCSSDASGQIALKMIGGTPPFDIELQTGNGQAQRFQVKDAKETALFESLRPGSYTLLVQDVNGQTFEENIYLETIDGPAVPLQTDYYLPENGLVIDLGSIKNEGIPTYQWTGPGGFSSKEENVRIDLPGHYTVAVRLNECFSFKSFQVHEAKASLIKEVKLLPNPVISQKPFQVKVSLFETETVTMNILDVLGNKVQAQVKKGQTHYLFDAKMDTPGTYLVNIQAANDSRTIRLIVQS